MVRPLFTLLIVSVELLRLSVKLALLLAPPPRVIVSLVLESWIFIWWLAGAVTAMVSPAPATKSSSPRTLL